MLPSDEHLMVYANCTFGDRFYSGSLLRRLVIHAASVTEASASKPAMAVYPVGVVLAAMALMATAGNNAILAIGFRPGCSVMNSATGGLAL